MKALSRYARKAGAPAKLVEQIATKAAPTTMAALLEHGFAWRSESLAEGTPKPLPLAFAVSFKARDSKRAKSSPLARLARTVSEASAGAFEGGPPMLPNDPAAIRDQVVQQAGDVTLPGLAEWAWRAGIVVVPMSGAGSSFSGAAWLIEERPVVVLNNSRTNVVSWLFDLAHEIGHQALRHPSERDVVDVDDPGKTEDEQEREATEFARALLVPDSDRLLEEIRELCVGHAREWQKEKFKWKAIEVAQRAGVNEAMLLTIAAYALTEIAEPVDRWGSAENHAALEGPARPHLQQSFAEHISTESMGEMDAALVEAVIFE